MESMRIFDNQQILVEGTMLTDGISNVETWMDFEASCNLSMERCKVGFVVIKQSLLLLPVRNKDLTWPEEILKMAKNKALVDKSQTGELQWHLIADYYGNIQTM